MTDFTLMEHQKEAVAKSFEENSLFLFWEMGTGKTLATVQMLRHRYSENGCLMKTLILAPLIVLQNWQREIQMFSNIPDRAVVVLSGSGKDRLKQIKKMEGANCIFITNYESMNMRDVAIALAGWRPEILVCDESHLLKNPQSKRAKAVAALSDFAKYKYLLTGTPILNSAMDLFMQYRILDGKDPNPTFGKNFFVFRNKYFFDANAQWAGKQNYFPDWRPRAACYQELEAKIAKKTLVVHKKDVLKELPPLVTETRFTDLSPEQMRVYRDVKKEYVAFIESIQDEPKAVIARLAITKALRLQQIVSGFVTTGEGPDSKIHEFESVPRLKAMEEILQELTHQHKVIIWAAFKQNYRQIAKVLQKMGVGYTEIHGEIPSKQKFANQDTFNQDPDCRVLIGNPGSGGVGINLVASSYSLYYSRGFKLGDDLQSESRNYRKGSEVHERVTRINLVTPGTIDEHIDQALSRKINITKEILKWKI